MAVKLDKEKACDRLGGALIKKQFSNLGFWEKWTHGIMKCITITIFSMIVNQKTGNRFKPELGTR